MREHVRGDTGPICTGLTHPKYRDLSPRRSPLSHALLIPTLGERSSQIKLRVPDSPDITPWDVWAHGFGKRGADEGEP